MNKYKFLDIILSPESFIAFYIACGVFRAIYGGVSDDD